MWHGRTFTGLAGEAKRFPPIVRPTTTSKFCTATLSAQEQLVVAFSILHWRK